MTVHYDAATGRTFVGGESIIDLYPWREMGLTAIIAMVAAALLLWEESGLPSQMTLRIPSL